MQPKKLDIAFDTKKNLLFISLCYNTEVAKLIQNIESGRMLKKVVVANLKANNLKFSRGT
jgi:hypothetical protein